MHGMENIQIICVYYRMSSYLCSGIVMELIQI